MKDILHGDALVRLRELQDQSVQTCVTSPPYFGLRNYGVSGQIRLEATPDEYVERLVEVFCEVQRVLRDDGTVWLNLGDTFANDSRGGGQGKNTASFVPPHRAVGLKSKDLIGIPWRVAFALQATAGIFAKILFGPIYSRIFIISF